MSGGRASRLRRGVGSILAGSIAGQLLAVLLTPLLSRLFDPAAFGSLTVFVALVSILSAVATLRLESAIVLPTEDKDAAAVAWAAGAAAAVVTALALLLTGAWASEISAGLGAPALAPVWWLVAAASLLIAFGQVFTSWIVREQRYGVIAVRNAAQGVGTTGGQVTLGYAELRSTGLLLGFTVGHVAAFGGLLSSRGLLRQPRPSWNAMVRGVSRYRRFPLVSTWSALLNTSGQQAPFLVLSAVYGDVVIGLIGLTARVLAGPAAIVGRAVAHVFQGEASADVRVGAGRLHQQVKSTSLLLLAVGTVPALALVASGPALFSFVFGQAWTEAGDFARVLAVAYLAQLAVSPVSQTLVVLERQGTQLVWDGLRLVLTAGTPLVAALLGASALAAVAVLSAASVLSYALLYVLCARAAKEADASCSTPSA